MVSRFELFSEDLRKIISELGFENETPAQTEAFPPILAGENVLIISPTGSGKTEAALLPIFERIKSENAGAGTKLVYVTPLRALNRDMLRRIEQWALRLGLSVGVRHGDTPTSERRRQALSPPDILITTPETLQVLLIGSRLRTTLKSLRCFVVDEIHQLASDRRGSQLSFGLERLERLVGKPIQRIGLSATVADPNKIGDFLCGNGRKFRVVQAQVNKQTNYKVEFPKPTHEDEIQSKELYISPQTMSRIQRIMDLIDSHDRTLIFVNSRTVAEELGSRLHLLGVKVGVHHGSLPREERERSEEEFKQGKIKALVCTATLELGIDIGSVDLVIQYMSPRQVDSLIQRVGRSGHNLARKSEGIILSASPEDALESYCISSDAREGNLEPSLIHDSPLDVLSHQVAGLLMEQGAIDISEVLELAHSSFSFGTLSKNDLTVVAKFMENMGYLSISGETLTRRRKCREYYLENLSTIRDERRYSVIDLTTHEKIGTLGEEFILLHAEIGLRFIIQGKTWQIDSMQEENVYVTPVKDPNAAIPGWDGELIPIPESVARRVGQERRRIESLIFSAGGIDFRTDLQNAEKSSRDVIVQEVTSQVNSSRVPTDDTIVVEKFKNYLVIHTSAGDRVNLTLGELFEERLVRMSGLVRHWWSDGYRILIELSKEEFDLDEITAKLLHYDPSLPGFIDGVMRKHFPFGYEMKFIAERFGALKRGRMLSGDALKELGVKFRFTPIYDETLREAYATKIDITRSVEILKFCSDGRIMVVTCNSSVPSPLAMYILSRYADSDYRGDEVNSVESMKDSSNKELVSLLCFDCATLKEFVRVGDLPDEPACEKCGSKLLAVLFFGARFAANALFKKKSGNGLTPEEKEIIAKTRRSADIVLSYGKRGVIAQTIYGVGPQMAARVLSRMHESEHELYEDLLKAKIKFIETKKYWD